MSFNSYIFILFFLPVTVLGYFVWNHWQKYELAKGWLLAMSLWFYAYFHISYLLIILCSICGNYLLYYLMEKGRKRKLLMILGVLGNLGILFYFKYFDFFVENIDQVLHIGIPLLNVLMPLGISFFTFQQVGFVVDAYKGEAKGYSFLDYAVFVSFFPQLVAGPIVTHEEFIPQLQDQTKKKSNADNVALGCMVFILGLSKKILIADIFGLAVDWGYENYASMQSLGLLLTSLAYTVQLYFDFSGYSDMARGLGLLFNFDLPMNFNSPYKACSITDFWKRWHMTLTRFLTRYVYIPCGGSRKGSFRTCCNLILVFLISGFWHGANWTYIIWGLLNGVACVVIRLVQKPHDRIPKPVRWLATYAFFDLSVIYFRSESVAAANLFIKRLFTAGWGQVPVTFAEKFQTGEFWYALKIFHLTNLAIGPYLLMIAYFLVAAFLLFGCRNLGERMKTFRPTVISAVVAAGLLLWCLISFSEVSTFLYFNF
ncbi:MAG: MBOAT family protein [Lachnospiraceae bacterium]|nr:MBOAT family protein [Lachnospiraceae bacterium]